jgi:phosphatidylinositol 4-kinase
LHSLERFRKDRKVLSNKSTYPARSHDQNVEACIFKVYDDCRQDAITIQVIRILRDVNDCLGIPSFLVPYTVIPNRTGNDNAHGGIVQVISDVKSRDQIGKEGFKTLLQLFESRFGPVGTAEFRAAQMEFCRSMAGYAVVCYLLQIKDRHNGNILIDKLGHIIHIDFGFLLGISPGGNLGFESAAFKFSNEMMELLSVEVDGYAHGVKKCPCESSAFKYFVLLTLRGFLAARAVMDQILVCDVISERC